MDAERIRMIERRLNISDGTQDLFVEIKGYTRELIEEVIRLQEEVQLHKDIAESCECNN